MSRCFHGLMAFVVLLVLGISAWGMPANGLRVDVEQLYPKFALYGVVLAGAAFYRYRRADDFVAALLAVFWMGLVSDLHIYPMYLAARQEAPLIDGWLANVDQTMGLEVTSVMAWINGYPWAKEALDFLYYTLVYLMTASLLATVFLGRVKAAQEYIVSCVCAVALTFPFFACWQALGPWTHYGYEPSASQAEYMRVFAAIKEGGLFTIDLRYASGLITFPSFHTILALLSGLALWSVPWLRWLGLAWAALIVLSTLTTGWHYVVDVLAGIGVTAVSFAAGKAFTWAEARWSARQPVLQPV